MRTTKRVNPLFLSALFLAVWIAGFSVLFSRLDQDTKAEQRTALENALERDITGCYALEGAYPPDLQYLKDHYGLTWDEKLFYVDYRPVAANIRPYYIIISLTEEAGPDRDPAGRDAGGSL